METIYEEDNEGIIDLTEDTTYAEFLPVSDRDESLDEWINDGKYCYYEGGHGDMMEFLVLALPTMPHWHIAYCTNMRYSIVPITDKNWPPSSHDNFIDKYIKVHADNLERIVHEYCELPCSAYDTVVLGPFHNSKGLDLQHIEHPINRYMTGLTRNTSWHKCTKSCLWIERGIRHYDESNQSEHYRDIVSEIYKQSQLCCTRMLKLLDKNFIKRQAIMISQIDANSTSPRRKTALRQVLETKDLMYVVFLFKGESQHWASVEGWSF